MDSQLNIAISGIPNKLSDLPLDASIMCAELLQNTLQSTGLNRNVQIVRTIGAKIFSHAIDTALSNNCRVHILFSVQHCQESYFDNPLPLLSTLQHRSATIYNFLLERFAFNNVAARSKLLAPNANVQLAGHLARSFEHNCDTAAVSLGTYSNQAQLNQIHRYAPAVARATAQALYRYITAAQLLPKRQGPQSSPAPYTNQPPQPSLYSTEHSPEDTPKNPPYSFFNPYRLEVIK